MSLIKCPECGGKVSDTVEYCIHCGYKLVTPKNKVSASTTTAKVSDDEPVLNNDLTTVSIRNGYDVMLIDYNGNKSNACKALSYTLSCSISDANKLLSNLPAYLYTDVEYKDAINVARLLQNEGMVIQLYDPLGKVTTYAPTNFGYTYNNSYYNNVARNPFFEILPQMLLMNSLRMLTSRSLNSIPRTVVYQRNRPSSYRTGSNFFGGPGSKGKR